MAEISSEFSGEDLKLLYRVAGTLLGERDYGELLSELLDATIEGLGADRGFVVVREESADPPHFRAAVARNYKSESLSKAEEEVSSSISSTVASVGRALLLGTRSTRSASAKTPASNDWACARCFAPRSSPRRKPLR